MRLRSFVGVLVTVVAISSASADSSRRKKNAPPPAPPPAPEQPAPAAEPAPEPSPTPAPAAEESAWNRGVTPESKAAAQQLLEEGNEKFVVNQFREAFEKYSAATNKWDHPAIRFNMVRTLIALERYLEAQANLEKALKYGKEPFEDSMYREALNYRQLLASQIATLEIGCKQASVDIKVDGDAFVACPGSSAKQLLPGKHVLVASKPGFQTDTKDLVLLPGKKVPIQVELITIEKATVYRSRWASWKPWAVAASGVVLGGLGFLVNAKATSDMDQLGKDLDRCGSDGCGVAVDPLTGASFNEYSEYGFQAREDSAVRLNRVAIGMMITGGVVVGAGIVGVIMNRPKPYLKETRDPKATTADIVPVLGSHGGGLAVTGRF